MSVTVVIPNYNHASYLRKRIDSVLAQTYPDFEVLLLDDCSTDDSRSIIESYRSHPRMGQIIYNVQNSSSTFKQWNKSFQLVSGKYVWIAESDDYADPSFLEKLVGTLEAQPDCGLAYSQSWRVDEGGLVHGTWGTVLSELDPQLWDHDFVIDGSELVRRFMVNRNIIPNASAVLMRRDVLQQIGPAPENMRVAGDWLFWIKYLMQTKVAFLAEPLNYFRFHENNVRTRTETDGTQLVETAQVLKYLKALVTPEPGLYKQTITGLMERWLHAFVYYKMPAARHREFFRIMEAAVPGFRLRLLRRFLHFLIRNKFSGLKMLVGDKILKSGSEQRSKA